MRLAVLMLLLSAALAITGCGTPADESDAPETSRKASAEPGFRTVEVTEVAGQIAAGDMLLVDVRTDEEWEAGHAASAVHVPLAEMNERVEEVGTAAEGRPVAFICRTGRRSAQAARVAVTAGIEDVVNVDGGMEAWAEAGLPLEPADGAIA